MPQAQEVTYSPPWGVHSNMISAAYIALDWIEGRVQVIDMVAMGDDGKPQWEPKN